MTDNNSDKTVAVDTENLDDFEELFSGKANPAEDTNEEETEVDTTEEDDLATEQKDEDQDEEEAEEPEDKQPQKKRKTAQERINELTRERREAERREAELIKRLEALESKESKTETKAEPVKTARAPSPDDVNDDGDSKYPLGEFDPGFIRDLTKFTIAEEAEAAKRAAAEAAEKSAAKAEFERISNEWSAKIENIEDRLPDFHERGAELEDTFRDIDPAHGEFIASTIMSLEYGPEVLYYLSENLDVAKRIVKANPMNAVIQLGRIEAQFLPKEGKKPNKVSAAPEPPPVATRGTGTKVEVPVDTDDLDAFSDVFYKKRK